MSSMDISEIINDRIKSSGKSQAEIAKEIETTPSQLGLFLKGEASLSRKSMNKCFEVLNIDLMMYKRRNDLAKRIAKALRAKRITDIDNLTQDDIIALTGEKDLQFFREEDEERYLEITESGYIDPESTYNYMKSLISYYLVAPDVDKITNKQAQMTVAKFKPWGAVKTGSTVAAAVAATATIATAGALPGLLGPLAAGIGLFGVINRNKKKGGGNKNS